MVDSIKIKILEELNKPLPANGIYIPDNIREHAGIPKEHTNDDWLIFYREFGYCIDGGLIVFLNEWDKNEFERETKNYRGVNFYLNYLMNKGVRITPQGEAWLAHMKSAKNIEDRRSVQTASENKLLSDNTTEIGSRNKIGLINIDFGNIKLSNPFGGKRSNGEKTLGVILMVIELVSYGILMPYNLISNNALMYITVGALFITVVIFFGVEGLIENARK